MWKNVCRALAAATMLPALGGGCDEKPKVPQVVSNESEPAAPHAHRPTTAQIVDAPRRSMPLGAYPLRLELPERLWQVKPSSESGAAASLSVQGPAPAGDIWLQVSGHPEMVQSAEELERFPARAAKEKAAHPDTALFSEFRPLGDAKVTETRALDADGGKFVDWQLLVYVPQLDKPRQSPLYETYAITFIGLTRKQYDQDRKFLEEIIASLRYDPTGNLGP